MSNNTRVKRKQIVPGSPAAEFQAMTAAAKAAAKAALPAAVVDHLTNDKTPCKSCAEDTLNNSDTFKLDRYMRNWSIKLKCAKCGKGKNAYLKKEVVAKFPEELRKIIAPASITKSDYIEKYGSALPLPALLPLIFAGSPAQAGSPAAGMVETTAGAAISKQNKEMESIATRSDLEARMASSAQATNILANAARNMPDDDEARKIKKYVGYLQTKGFGFYS